MCIEMHVAKIEQKIRTAKRFGRKSLIISVCIGDYFIKMLYEIIYCISECRQIILYNIPYQISVDVKITMSGVRF